MYENYSNENILTTYCNVNVPRCNILFVIIINVQRVYYRILQIILKALEIIFKPYYIGEFFNNNFPILIFFIFTKSPLEKENILNRKVNLDILNFTYYKTQDINTILK